MHQGYASSFPIDASLSLDELCARIDEALHSKGEELQAELTNTLHEAGQPGPIIAVLQSLLADDVRLAEVAQRSFQHRNGFVKLRLNTAREYALRLHVWTGDSDVQPEGNVHDHRWSFASHMLCGHFRVKTYAMDEAGELPLHSYRYMRHAVEDRYHFEDAGVRRFALTGDQIMLAGSTYYMEARVFHRLIFPLRTTTATLVVTLLRSREWCYSCSEQPREPAVEHEMEHLTIDEVRGYVAHVLRAMNAPMPVKAAGG